MEEGRGAMAGKEQERRWRICELTVTATAPSWREEDGRFREKAGAVRLTFAEEAAEGKRMRGALERAAKELRRLGEARGWSWLEPPGKGKMSEGSVGLGAERISMPCAALSGRAGEWEASRARRREAALEMVREARELLEEAARRAGVEGIVRAVGMGSLGGEFDEPDPWGADGREALGRERAKAERADLDREAGSGEERGGSESSEG